jgi:hypothetical protein
MPRRSLKYSQGLEAVISSEEAESLINKLITEEVPVCACFWDADGSAITLNGSMERLPEGLMIWGEDEDEHPQRVSSMLLHVDKTCEFGFQDKRETPVQVDPEHMAAKYGELILWIRFPSGSRVMIFFKD